MNLVFIIDPLESLKIEKDSSIAMMQEAIVRDHRVFVMHQGDLSYENNIVMARVNELQPKQSGEIQAHWFDLGPEEIVPLAQFDIVLMRKDPLSIWSIFIAPIC